MAEARMPNILITGTPGTGKTSFATLLSDAIGLEHINVADLIKEKKLYEGWDEELQCHILNEDLLLDELEDPMQQGGKVIDYHSCDFFPERWFSCVIVLQTNVSVLHDRLSNRGYTGQKLSNNIECEIFQVLLEEANESYSPDIVLPLPSNTIEDMSNNVEAVQQWLQTRR